jgi:hypothetical protein
MIKPDISRPGFVTIVDTRSRRHVVSVSAIGAPQATSPTSTYLTLRGYKNLFVNCPIGEVTEAVKRARALRKAAVATPTQMELAFHD